MPINNSVLQQERENAREFIKDIKDNSLYTLQDKKLKNELKNFLKCYTKKHIASMKKDDYCIGKGSEECFCYRIEIGLRAYGSISGSPSTKFGVYYSKKNNKYMYVKRFGNSFNSAFKNVKEEIVRIVESAKNKNIYEASKSKLSYMCKYKIYFLYSDFDDIPIFSEKHVDLLIEYFGIDYDEDRDIEVNKRKALYNFKKNDEVFNQLSNLEFVRFIYSKYFGIEIKVPDNYGSKSKKEIESIEPIQKLINKAINKKHRTNNYTTIDHKDVAEKKSGIGKMGEELVLQYEKKNNPNYARKIKSVSNRPDLGYDILSYDNKGKEKHIEVKTKRSGNINNVDFYITENELEKLQNKNHYIYYVCNISGNHPKAYSISKEALNKDNLIPVLYRVKAEAKS